MTRDSIALADMATGRPVFAASQAQTVAKDRGDAAGWRLLFASFGERAPLQVSGPFAAVDRFAIESLCYRIDAGRLRVAAQADALADSATQRSQCATRSRWPRLWSSRW